MMMPSTEMAPRSPLSLRSKISTEITLVSEVNSMIAADSSRITPTKMKHQVAITLVRSSGAVMWRERLQPRRAEDAACLLEVGIDGAERRLQLLIGGRQRDRDEGDQQDPERAVEHEGRARVAQEQADAEHDAGHRDRRGREEAERAMPGDRLARREIGDHQRDDRADRGRREMPRMNVFLNASLVAESSKNTKWILCSVDVAKVTSWVATGENAALSSAP